MIQGKADMIAQQSQLGTNPEHIDLQGLQYVHSWRNDKDDKRAHIPANGTSNSLFKFIL